MGERVLLLDAKRRRYLVVLTDGGEFHSHAGFVPHGDMAGRPEGTVVRSTKGAEYTVLRPTLEDFVLEMPRGAQVIYPKDLAPICMLADIGPGMRVFETGVGSGALSMTMLRYGAEIVGYEMREDFANRARNNVRAFLGDDALARYRVELRDSYEGIDPTTARSTGWCSTCPSRGRSCPTPRPCCERAASSSPTRRRSPRQRRRERRCGASGSTPGRSRSCTAAGTSKRQAVRPDHRMVAHTGFLTTARFLGR